MTASPEIPGYGIKRKINNGVTATVYLGIQDNLSREVAIKVLNRELEQEDAYVQHFLNEARIVAKLTHKNIVTVHDVGDSDYPHYFVMERLGESLKDKLKKNGRMPVKKILEIFKQLASALEYVHSHRYVHRDIKPGNILFRNDGTPVIVDFGLAKVINSNVNIIAAKKTKGSGTTTGTPGYRSPEQCRGEPVDHLSDIYSLGVVLYEMLSGKAAYRSKHSQEAGENAPIPLLPKELQKFQPLIDRMMAKDKDDRICLNDAVEKFIKLMKCKVRVFTKEGYVNRKPESPDFSDSNTMIKKICLVIAIIFLVLITLFLLYLLKCRYEGNSDGSANSVDSNVGGQQQDGDIIIDKRYI